MKLIKFIKVQPPLMLQKFSIKTSQISYRDQNHDRIFPNIIERLKNGESLALVSDSGTPLISDPGFKLVREVRSAGFQVLTVPGPSAVTAALSISGLPTDKFIFLGFLPKSDKQKKDLLLQYGLLDATLTIYESPYRVKRLLEEVQETLGNRTVCLVKDLTKVYESVITKPVSDILANHEIKEKGEYIVLIAKEGYLLA